MQGAGAARNSRFEVQGLHRLRQEVSGRGDQRQGSRGARDRRRQVHQVRRVQSGLPVRSDRRTVINYHWSEKIK